MADEPEVITPELTTVVPTPPVESIPEEPKKADELLKELVQQCTTEVNATLDKYGCEFDITMILKSGSTTPIVSVVLKKNK